MTASRPLRHRPDTSLDFLAGGGELGADMRGKDWASTELGDGGAVAAEPPHLGEHLPQLPLPGAGVVGTGAGDALQRRLPPPHRREAPAALGQPGRECWPEIWHVIGPMLDAVLSRGESTWSEDLMLPLERKGFPEECYFTFSYSPIRDEAGEVGGVFCAVVETTSQVLAARRIRTLRRLAEIASVGRTEADALAMSMETLRDSAADVPWALYQELGEEGPEPPVSVGLERPEVEALAPVLPACAERVRETRSAQDLPSSAGEGAASPGVGDAHREERLGPERAPGARPQPDDRLRRVVPDVLRAGRSCAGRVAGDRPGLRGGEAAGRGAGRARPRQDHLLQQHQPRVPHPADPDARPAGRAARLGRGPRATPAASCELVHRNALRLQQLVNALLDFSRIEAGRANAIFRPTDLAALTADLASDASARPSSARGCGSRSTLRRWPSRSTSTATCGRRSSSTSSPTPSSSPSRGRSPSGCASDGRARRC